MRTAPRNAFRAGNMAKGGTEAFGDSVTVVIITTSGLKIDKTPALREWCRFMVKRVLGILYKRDFI